MNNCKYYSGFEGVCLNADCPKVADFCNCEDHSECEYYEPKGEDEMAVCKDCMHYCVCRNLNFSYLVKKTGNCPMFKDKNKIIEIPCNVDEIVFIVIDCEKPFISTGKIKSFSYNKINLYAYAVYDCGLTYWHTFNDIGKTVFLSREEAEQRLKELEK